MAKALQYGQHDKNGTLTGLGMRIWLFKDGRATAKEGSFVENSIRGYDRMAMAKTQYVFFDCCDEEDNLDLKYVYHGKADADDDSEGDEFESETSIGEGIW